MCETSSFTSLSLSTSTSMDKLEDYPIINKLTESLASEIIKTIEGKINLVFDKNKLDTANQLSLKINFLSYRYKF